MLKSLREIKYKLKLLEREEKKIIAIKYFLLLKHFKIISLDNLICKTLIMNIIILLK